MTNYVSGESLNLMQYPLIHYQWHVRSLAAFSAMGVVLIFVSQP